MIVVMVVLPELPHPPHRCPDDGLHAGDDQRGEGGVQRQALLQRQCLQGAAVRPGGRHVVLDQQGESRAGF